MNKVILIALFVFSALSFNTIQGSIQQKTAAKIKFEKTSHDFGKIKKGKTVSVDFNYKNEGNDLLFISRVVKTCGCTEPEFSQEPIAPGQAGKVKIGYNTTTQPLGSFTKNVSVFSNAENATVVLTFKGEIVE